MDCLPNLPSVISSRINPPSPQNLTLPRPPSLPTLASIYDKKLTSIDSTNQTKKEEEIIVSSYDSSLNQHSANVSINSQSL